MKMVKFLKIVLLSIFVSSCATLNPPTSIKNENIENYKYVFVSPTNSLSSAYVWKNYSSSKSVNPSDVITGVLSKKGFIKIPELSPELAEQTLIVNYGESGRRNTTFGYAIEVTIQFISVKTNSLVSSCTAEGQGETEADDIRQAITRCLNEVLNKK